MQIRPAKPADKNAILDLLDELLETTYKSGQKQKNSVKDFTIHGELFDQLLQRKDVRIFVIEDDNKIIGVADLFILPIMRRGYYQGHIEDFVITKDMRGKGIGTQLFTAIKEYCVKNNIKVIKLTSHNYLKEAHMFYEKQGGKSPERMFRFDL